MVKILLAHEADSKAQDESGRTALIPATEHQQNEIVAMLQEAVSLTRSLESGQ